MVPQSTSLTNSVPEERKLGTAQKRYTRLAQNREPYLTRAKKCSRYTIPTLIPENDNVEGQDLPSLYQSVGANGVTNLSSKLLMTMLPPNEPCFRLRVNNMILAEEEEMYDKAFLTEIDKKLSRIEQTVLGDIEEKGDRSVVFEGNQHLIVSGNGLYHDDPEKGLRFFPLSRFVVDRDSAGNPVEIITKETVSIALLSEPMQELVLSLSSNKAPEGQSVIGDEEQKARLQEQETDIYTHLTREGDMWNIYQEVVGYVVEGSVGSYRVDSCPWFPVRMYSVAGEAYGRSFVELQLGDLTTLESLNQAVSEGSSIAAYTIGLVNPNGVTSARAITEARNGDFIEGRVEDVEFLQTKKATDINVAAQKAKEIEVTLKTSFLMMDGVRRDGERVTAEEIRTIARELEAGLGGVYTLVSQEFQLPFIRSRMAHLTKANKLPALPKGVVEPSVVTGFEALGRGNDKAKLVEFLQFVLQGTGGAGAQYLNVGTAIQRLASSMGIPTEGLIKTDEELQQEQQAAMQMQQQAAQQELLGNVAPEVVRQVGNNISPEQIAQLTG